ncbi:unnamed protein product [Rangifer tarandus platyrhynchus]|uniref:Uncharacterized protein n=1 Tax=Rangifer tarandus platyrhynchus TaxID=3082113 RepID=A0AC59Z4N7_RANTA
MVAQTALPGPAPKEQSPSRSPAPSGLGGAFSLRAIEGEFCRVPPPLEGGSGVPWSPLRVPAPERRKKLRDSELDSPPRQDARRWPLLPGIDCVLPGGEFLEPGLASPGRRGLKRRADEGMRGPVVAQTGRPPELRSCPERRLRLCARGRFPCAGPDPSRRRQEDGVGDRTRRNPRNRPCWSARVSLWPF